MHVQRRVRGLTDRCYRRSLLRQVRNESDNLLLKFDSNIDVPKKMQSHLISLAKASYISFRNKLYGNVQHHPHFVRTSVPCSQPLFIQRMAWISLDPQKLAKSQNGAADIVKCLFNLPFFIASRLPERLIRQKRHVIQVSALGAGDFGFDGDDAANHEPKTSNPTQVSITKVMKNAICGLTTVSAIQKRPNPATLNLARLLRCSSNCPANHKIACKVAEVC
jgi:hypothetical protein